MQEGAIWGGEGSWIIVMKQRSWGRAQAYHGTSLKAGDCIDGRIDRSDAYYASEGLLRLQVPNDGSARRREVTIHEDNIGVDLVMEQGAECNSLIQSCGIFQNSRPWS